MPAYRFFKREVFHINQTLILEDDECHHLKNVMRHKVGDQIEIINGMGGLACAKITEIKKREALALITQTKFFTKEYDLILLQAVPKTHKLDFITEKGTELGMSKLFLFPGEKSAQKFKREKIKRLELKAISALKQTGRYYLPVIEMIPSISHLEILSPYAYYGDVNIGASPLCKELPKHFDSKTFYFCSGPEAGFSRKEIKELKERNFKGVSLHPNVLRTETAALVFLSLAYHHLHIHTDSPVIN